MNRPHTMAFRVSNGTLMGLGNDQQVVTSLPGIAIGGTLTATGAAAAGAAAVGGGILGTTVGIAIPVVGTALGLILGSLLSAHYAREKGAQNENAALSQVFPAVYQDFQTVIQAYNSGQLDASDSITAINQIYSNYQQAMAQYQTQPGTKNSGCTGAPPPVPGPNITPTKCDTSCTAGCCIQCNVIASWVAQAVAAFTQGNGQVQFGSGGASKYGFPAWSYPPAAITAPSGANSSTGNTAAGAPSMSLGPVASIFTPPSGGGWSIGDWLLAGAAIFVATRIF